MRAAQDSEQAFITLTSEEDGTQLVKTKVHGDGTYTRQQGESARRARTRTPRNLAAA